jgi:hypothetical protein
MELRNRGKETKTVDILAAIREGRLKHAKAIVLVNGQNLGVCHIYGDPHIIPFLQPPQTSSNSYWCKLSGEHSILRNEYVEIVAAMRNGTWLIEKVGLNELPRVCLEVTLLVHYNILRSWHNTLQHHGARTELQQPRLEVSLISIVSQLLMSFE